MSAGRRARGRGRDDAHDGSNGRRESGGDDVRDGSSGRRDRDRDAQKSNDRRNDRVTYRFVFCFAPMKTGATL